MKIELISRSLYKGVASIPEYFQGCLLTYKFFFGKTYNPGYQLLDFRFERLQPYRLVPNLRNTRILGYNK